MEVIGLILFVTVAWLIATVADSLPHLGQLLIPPLWLWGVMALVVTTWLMRD
jgi:hypothetical protein